MKTDYGTDQQILVFHSMFACYLKQICSSDKLYNYLIAITTNAEQVKIFIVM